MEAFADNEALTARTKEDLDQACIDIQLLYLTSHDTFEIPIPLNPGKKTRFF